MLIQVSALIIYMQKVIVRHITQKHNSMQLIDGKAINQQMQAEILQQVEEMVKNGQKRPPRRSFSTRAMTEHAPHQ